jgi:AcrR family transcriptional regulator
MRERNTSDRPPRQERALRTRESVVSAAASVFDRQGFGATRLDEIAAAAGVSKGALYFHFASKSAIAVAIIEHHHARGAKLVLDSQNWGLDGLSTVERFINELAISYQRDTLTRAGIRLGNEYRTIGTEVPVPVADCIGWVGRLLRNARSDGTLDSAVEPTAAARIVVGSFFGIQEMSAQLTNCRDLIQRVHEWWAFIRPALTAGPRDSLAQEPVA